MFTVLYVDIVDSMKVGMTIQKLNAFFAKTVPFVMTMDGAIEKYTGDGFIAFWYPDRQSQVESIASSVREAAPYPCRMGIFTGEGEIGEVGIPKRKEVQLIGEAIIVANALRKIAQPGEILCGDKQSRLQLEIKGKKYSFKRI